MMKVKFKIVSGGSIHLLPSVPPDFESFRAAYGCVFPSADATSFYYFDKEGDRITLAHQLDYGSLLAE
jgi:hypothetical protein